MLSGPCSISWWTCASLCMPASTLLHLLQRDVSHSLHRSRDAVYAQIWTSAVEDVMPMQEAGGLCWTMQDLDR